MSKNTPTPAPATRAQLRTIPLSRIVVADGFNPRQQIVRDREFDALVATVRDRGLLQPIRVRETGTGDYVIVAGHRRHAAAIVAALMEIPCVVVSAGAGDDAEQAELLVDALIENDVRTDLTPVDRAMGYAQLKANGLTVKGIAERLATTQARVREHLAILELGDAERAQLATGEIPLLAVKPLALLAKIHRELPALAVERVLSSQADRNEDRPLTWGELAEDPIAHCTRNFDYLGGRLPAGIFDVDEGVALDDLPLEEKTHKALAELAALGRPASRLLLGPDVQEQAATLGAFHPAAGYAGGLIVGADVLAQIASDQVAATLKEQRKLTRERKARDAEHAATAGDPGTAEAPSTPPVIETAVEREEREKAERAAERAAELARRAAADAFNDRLGAALVNSMSRVKVDARVMGVLLSTTFGDHIDMLTMRGARYGFPGWVTVTETAGGKSKREYLTHPQAGEKARQYLEGAKTPGDYAGRALALIAMAVYADQEAVAMSNRVHHSVRAAGTPWAPAALEQLDELLGDYLPAGILDEQLAAHAQARAEAAQALVDERVAREQIQAAIKELPAQTVEQLQARLADLDTAYPRYSIDRYPIERQLREALKALTTDSKTGPE